MYSSASCYHGQRVTLRLLQGELFLTVYVLLYAEQPFYIVCGSKYDRYLEARPISGMNLIFGVTDKENASVFSVEERKTKGPYKYKLFLVLPDASETQRPYVARSDKKRTRKGSVEVGGGRAIKFSLSTGSGEGEGLTVADWEEKPCRVNVAAQKKDGYIAGYLGYSETQNMCEFIENGDAEKEGKMWLHYKLEQLEADAGEGSAKAPKGMRVKPPIIVRPCIDSDSD